MNEDEQDDDIDINVYSDDEAIANTRLTPQAAAELWKRIEAVDARIAAMSPEELEEREARLREDGRRALAQMAHSWPKTEANGG